MACCKCCCGGVDCAEGDEGKCCCGGGSGVCCQVGEYCCGGSCDPGPCCYICVWYSEDDCGYTVPNWDCSLSESECDDIGGTYTYTGSPVYIPAYTAKPGGNNCQDDEQEYGPYDVDPCDCTFTESPLP